MLGRLKVPFILTFFSMLLSSCSDINPEVSCIASCNEAKTFEYSQHDGSLNFKGIFMQNSEVHLFEDGVEVPVQSTFGTNTLKIVPIANAPHQLKPSSMYKIMVTSANANGTSTFMLPASTSNLTLSGDVTGDNSTTSVQRIRGTPVSATAPTAGSFLKYDGAAWGSSTLSSSDVSGLSTALSSKIDQSQMPSSCGASSTLSFSSPSGTFTCNNIAITDSQVTYANQTARTFFGAPSAASGAPTFRALTMADMPSGLTSSQWATSGSNISYVAGSVGIGTTSPTATLDVNGKIVSSIAPTNSSELALGYEDSSNQGLRIISYGSAHPTVNNRLGSIIYGNTSGGSASNGGSLEFNTANAVMRLKAPGNTAGRVSFISSSNVEMVRIYPNVTDLANNPTMSVEGYIFAANFQYSSDLRYKRDISSIENPLDKLLKIRGVTYNWRRDEFPEKKFSNRHQIGLIAQEVEKQFPEAVSSDEKGYKSVGYASLVAPIIEAIRELTDSKADKTEIEKLRSENAELKARLDRLEKSLLKN